MTFYLLYEIDTAEALFDAFVAAEQGDCCGLAVTIVGLNENMQSTSKYYWGEYFTKAVSGGLDTTWEYETDMIPPGSILGSPRDKLFWSAASEGGWRVKQIPLEYRQLDTTYVETLIVNGSLDFSSPSDCIMEAKPHFKNGNIFFIAAQSHVGVINSQHAAFEHLFQCFYLEGVVDTSKYSVKKIDFAHAKTHQDYTKQLFNVE